MTELSQHVKHYHRNQEIQNTKYKKKKKKREKEKEKKKKKRKKITQTFLFTFVHLVGYLRMVWELPVCF